MNKKPRPKPIQPAPRQRQTTVTYWRCGAEHCAIRHQSEETALRCQKAKTGSGKTAGEWADRREAVWQSYMSGSRTLKQVGDDFGISASRTRQIIVSVKRQQCRSRRLPMEALGLGAVELRKMIQQHGSGAGEQ